MSKSYSLNYQSTKSSELISFGLHEGTKGIKNKQNSASKCLKIILISFTVQTCIVEHCYHWKSIAKF